MQQRKRKSEFTFSPENPVLWNAEKPFLYTVVLERDGEIISIKTGMRSISISNQFELLINGVSVKIRGVNHHDTSKFRGWCMSQEELRKDLELMKDLNINAVRTSHYPPHPSFIQMCDEMGFYVICETDIETHGFSCRLAETPGYDRESIDCALVRGCSQQFRQFQIVRSGFHHISPQPRRNNIPCMGEINPIRFHHEFILFAPTLDFIFRLY